MSNDAPQPVDEISASSKELDEWVVVIKDRIDKQIISDPTQSLQPNYSTDQSNSKKEKPSIFCSTPHVVNFGPIKSIHNTPAWQFVAFMTRWFGLNVRSYLEDIQEKEHLVWGYYQGLDPEYRAEERKLFLEYLLINSCIILFVLALLPIQILSLQHPGYQRSTDFHFLYELINKDPKKIECEMLSMECQIPWFVVEDVYTKHSNLSNLVQCQIPWFFVQDIYHYPREYNSNVKTVPPGGFKHLLHLFHCTRTPMGKYMLILPRYAQKMDSFYIPSAKDLQLSATLFEKDVGINVSYKERRLSGVMQIAPWHIFKYTDKLYKDLLRFERGYGVVCGFPVTAYVACMVCLLQTEEDVRLLRENGIIPNTGNDEKAVLSFVQQFKTVLSNDIIMPSDLCILSIEVRTSHQRRFSRYYAEFKSSYCPNPWITISVVAAICLFVLTFIQTIYGTLSYYKQ